MKHGGKLLTAQLVPMIFMKSIVPSSFCIEYLTPISKKEKPEFQSTFFRPTTVATSLCKLFELLFIRELEKIGNNPSTPVWI